MQKTLTVRQAARLAGVSEKTIRRLIARFDHGDPDGLPAKRVGAGREKPHRRVLREDLARLFVVA